MEIDRPLAVQLLKVLIHYKTLLHVLDGKSTVVDDYVLDDLLTVVEEGLGMGFEDEELSEIIDSAKERVVIDFQEEPQDPGHFVPVNGLGKVVLENEDDEDDEETEEEENQQLVGDIKVDKTIKRKKLKDLPRLSTVCVFSPIVALGSDVDVYFETPGCASVILDVKDESQEEIFVDYLCINDGELLIGDRTSDVVQWHSFAPLALPESWFDLLKDGKTYEVK